MHTHSLPLIDGQEEGYVMYTTPDSYGCSVVIRLQVWHQTSLGSDGITAQVTNYVVCYDSIMSRLKTTD